MSVERTPCHCVLIPFCNRLDEVVRGVETLLPQMTRMTRILLVDDASEPPAEDHPGIRLLLLQDGVSLIRHDENRGVSAARNSGLHWCRAQQCEVVIMLDSDCAPPSDFIAAHLSLHESHPDAACIGGGIVGVGSSFWARLDGVLSWVHAVPHGSVRPVLTPYHLPTTNFSAKIDRLPARELVFDERLQTGEDCSLIRELRAARKCVLFSPEPQVRHRDREALADVLSHHYRWGFHQYFLQLGRDFSMPVFAGWYRSLFVLVFFSFAPLFALACSVLNVFPWLRYRPLHALWWPFAYGIWLAKCAAILQAAIMPQTVLRRRRESVAYREILRASEGHSTSAVMQEVAEA